MRARYPWGAEWEFVANLCYNDQLAEDDAAFVKVMYQSRLNKVRGGVAGAGAAARADLAGTARTSQRDCCSSATARIGVLPIGERRRHGRHGRRAVCAVQVGGLLCRHDAVRGRLVLAGSALTVRHTKHHRTRTWPRDGSPASSRLHGANSAPFVLPVHARAPAGRARSRLGADVVCRRPMVLLRTEVVRGPAVLQVRKNQRMPRHTVPFAETSDSTARQA